MSEAPWSVVFAEEPINDLQMINHVLMQSYCDFGQPPAEAKRQAQVRIAATMSAAERLSTAPFRGECHEDLLPGLCYLALHRALTWFVHALNRETSSCWQRSLVDRVISVGCWYASCKTAPKTVI